MLQRSTSYRALMILGLVTMSIFASAIAQTNPAKGPSPEPKAEATPTPPATTDYDIRWGVKIPLRDKVELNATLYFPKTPDGSLPKTPVIFTLTPYISDSYHARAAYFASHGYVFPLIDVRGRGHSAGEFEPFAQQPRDGHDVCEWLAQLFCRQSFEELSAHSETSDL